MANMNLQARLTTTDVEESSNVCHRAIREDATCLQFRSRLACVKDFSTGGGRLRKNKNSIDLKLDDRLNL